MRVADLSLPLSRNFRKAGHGSRKVGGAKKRESRGKQAIGPSAIRSLGAWIGNGIDSQAPWTPVIQAIKKNLDRWAQRNPTMYGRKLIVGMEGGRRSQFLAKVQGMPKDIERELEKIIIDFVWNGDAHPRISKATLYHPVEEGGLNLLDIKSRNEAIDIMWLKSYLDISPARPRWAMLADVLLKRASAASAKNLDDTVKVNTFLQDWKVSTRAKAGLPDDLIRMVKVAGKYRVKLQVMNPSEDLKMALPIWLHPGGIEGRRIINSKAMICLRDNHGVQTVGGMAKVAKRMRNNDHKQTAKCRCSACDSDRRANACDNPARCAAAARKTIDKLIPTWKPERDRPADGLSLTKS